MELTENDQGRYVVLAPAGRLNLVSAPTLQTRIGELVAGGQARVVVDLSGVEFIDSSGLGALIGGLKVARQAGGDLRVAGAGTQITAVLQLTNLNRRLAPAATAEEAAAAW